MTTVAQLCSEIIDLAGAIGVDDANADRRAIPAEAIAHLRQAVEALRRARPALARCVVKQTCRRLWRPES